MNQPYTSAVLFTINLRSIAHFYESVIGMRVHRQEDDHIVLERHAFRLTVHQIPEEYARDIVIAVPPEVRETSAIKLSFPIESIARSRATAARLGGCVYATDQEWSYEGATMCDGWDPDGNVFQLSERSQS